MQALSRCIGKNLVDYDIASCKQVTRNTAYGYYD